MMDFFVGVLASLLAALIFPSLMEFISQMMVRYLEWLPFRKKVDLKGKWESEWSVESDRFPKKVKCTNTNVNQLGNRFYTTFKVGDADFYAYGEIDSGRYLTGYWKDKSEGGYHGTFQLIIDPVSRNMNGLWIGYSTKGIVKHGEWEWHRIGSLDEENS